MEVIVDAIRNTLDSFDFAYCITVNLLTYFIISIVNDRRGHKDLSTWKKRYILLAVILSTGVLYYVSGSSARTIINSAILAPVFWSWILKPICKHFKIDYKDINLFE